jgi:cytochrome b involved in lipid metabolism
MMKKYFFILPLILFVISCTAEKPIGRDKDEYGCLIAAGYQWCPSTEKCQRMWEEYCEEYSAQFREINIQNFEDCEKAGLPVMESYPRQCRLPSGKIFVEEIAIPAEEPVPEPQTVAEEQTQQGITAEELAKHNSFKDCWVVYEGKVYDITDAPTHPNMPKTFWSHCGNLTSFEEAAKARHSSSSEDRVSNYGIYIGELI